MAEEAPGAGPAAVPISLSPLLPPPQMVVVALDATRDHREVEVRMSLRAFVARGDILRGGDSLLVLGVLHSVTNPNISGDSVLKEDILLIMIWKAMPIAETTPTEAAASIHNLQSPRALALLESARKIVGQSTFLKAFPGNVNDTAEPALDPSLRRLTMLYYPRSKSSFSASERLSPSLFLWETLRYFVVSTEIASRDRMSNYSAQSKSCLESLRSELNSSSGFILSLLFRVSHSARVLNRREVLLRFEGIQLLAGSICSGISGDKDLLDATKRKGTSLPMVDPESEGEIFPDIQFWKQCADPVLAQDPFSSLMSAFFSLPIEVLTSTEFFIPIVHLFYIVCVIQALITCYGQEAFDISIFHGCLLNDVCQEMSGYDIAREYFVSKHIGPFCEKCPISIYIRESSGQGLVAGDARPRGGVRARGGKVEEGWRVGVGGEGGGVDEGGVLAQEDAGRRLPVGARRRRTYARRQG
ncbi:E3 ubiquitin-protein ligase PRT6 [Hordeum vulgare]|nr:E3 ubiquitin-protein ligase PRT6 [Hordeum vulgare]